MGKYFNSYDFLFLAAARLRLSTLHTISSSLSLISLVLRSIVSVLYHRPSLYFFLPFLEHFVVYSVMLFTPLSKNQRRGELGVGEDGRREEEKRSELGKSTDSTKGRKEDVFFCSFSSA